MIFRFTDAMGDGSGTAEENKASAKVIGHFSTGGGVCRESRLLKRRQRKHVEGRGKIKETKTQEEKTGIGKQKVWDWNKRLTMPLILLYRNTGRSKIGCNLEKLSALVHCFMNTGKIYYAANVAVKKYQVF